MKKIWRRPFKNLVLLATGLFLSQCDRLQTFAQAPPPKPTPYDFSISITMADTAKERLKRSGDNLDVAVFFYGFPKDAFKAKADELNRLELGYQSGVFSKDARILRINSQALNPALLAQVKDGKAYALITVFPVMGDGFEEKRFDYLLECQNYAGTIAELQTGKVVIACDKYRA